MKNKDNMTPVRWNRIKAINWMPYRAPAYGRHFSKTAWAGRKIG